MARPRTDEAPRLTQEQLLIEAAATAAENVASRQQMLRLAEAARVVAPPRARPGGPRLVWRSKIGHADALTFTEVDDFPPALRQPAIARRAWAAAALGVHGLVWAGRVRVCLGAWLRLYVQRERERERERAREMQDSACVRVLYLLTCCPRAAHRAAKCVITGLRARYRDPVTLQPYANVEAYRELLRRRGQGAGGAAATLPKAQSSGGDAAAGTGGLDSGEVPGSGGSRAPSPAAAGGGAGVDEWGSGAGGGGGAVGGWGDVVDVDLVSGVPGGWGMPPSLLVAPAASPGAAAAAAAAGGRRIGTWLL